MTQTPSQQPAEVVSPSLRRLTSRIRRFPGGFRFCRTLPSRRGRVTVIHPLLSPKPRSRPILVPLLYLGRQRSQRPRCSNEEEILFDETSPIATNGKVTRPGCAFILPAHRQIQGTPTLSVIAASKPTDFTPFSLAELHPGSFSAEYSGFRRGLR